MLWTEASVLNRIETTYEFIAYHRKIKRHNAEQYLSSMRSWYYFDRPKTWHSMTYALTLNHPKTSDKYWAWDQNYSQPHNLPTTTLPKSYDILRDNPVLKLNTPERTTMNNTTLACTSPRPGFHNRGKYQTKDPDESDNLRQKLRLYFKIN